MEKRKVFKISIIDKEISRTEFDRNTFYTSDSELTLVFKLIEENYKYDHGEILLYNENDKSFVTRQITKKENDFVYELDSDIIPHYGTWKAQLQLVNDGDVYTSKPFDFSIANDLSNLAPQPTLTDINNWATLKQSANELIDEMQDIIATIEKAELERVNNENYRKNTESERANKENLRQQGEIERVNNEKQRVIVEFERVNKESERQQSESKRVENENKRNLTSIDEFIKLQDSVGGRNLVKNANVVTKSDRDVRIITNQIDWFKENIGEEVTLSFKLKGPIGNRVTVYPYQNASGLTIKFNIITFNLSEDYTSYQITGVIENNEIPTGYTKGEIIFLAGKNETFNIIEVKIEKGKKATPYTKAPEDYISVSKDDYYNHIELMNKFKDSQFNQLKQAVIALGGTI